MSQWYPKMCEYDYEGWHPTPYIAREFYGVWGDYEVNITIDKNYMIGGTGYLQNPNQIGFGYQDPGVRMMKPTGPTLTWRFVAPNVHDFMWAADPDYMHLTRTIAGGRLFMLFIIMMTRTCVKCSMGSLMKRRSHLAPQRTTSRIFMNNGIR